ncbi:MAG: AMP-binding protein [Clostridia bacterium]|nr:AMP-binding protein [Clostridia bacterium]
MSKQYTVRNHKKREHIYNHVENISQFCQSLESWGDKDLYVWKEKGETRSLSFTEFTAIVYRFADGLLRTYGSKNPALGTCLNENVRIGIIGETSPWWVASYLAVLLAGGVAIPMDKELDPAVTGEFLASVDATCLIHSAAFNDTFRDLPAGHSSVKFTISFDPAEDAPETCLPFAKVLAAGEEAGADFDVIRQTLLDLPIDNTRLAEMLFTSGTTGSSKCVMLSQKNIYAAVTSADATVDFTSDDTIVSVLPIHHTYELCCMMAAINLGVTVCINDSLRHVLNSFKEYKPTGLVLVPLFVNTMYKRILSEAKRSGKDKALAGGLKIAAVLNRMGIDVSEKLFKDVREAFGGRINKIICGGAALDASLIPVFESFGISMYEGYGITECSPLVAVTPYFKRKCGSIGPAVPCCEVRITGSVLTDDGHITGEVQVRGDNVMLGYYNNAEANSAAFTDDGWFRTGDVGYMDKEGYITITGRMKSVIVLDNGKNVFPEEIEEYLGKIDLITESVVVGREEEDGSTKLTAVIFPNTAVFEEKFADQDTDIYKEIQKEITNLNKKLPSFKQIHKLEFRKTEFEKTSSRKIKRFLV